MLSIVHSFLQYLPFTRRRNYNGYLTRSNEIPVIHPGNSKAEDVFSKIKESIAISDFHGYGCVDFVFNSRACKLVKPNKAAPGNPWLWRARFWDHQPQVDVAMLENGFHVAYCDVVELFGNEKSVSIWNDFYDYMQVLGLSEKVALHAMSRGSFYAYNWALQNGEKVSCLYADNPILDIKSWPWNKGRGIGSKKDRRLFRNAFNFKNEQDALEFRGNPLDRAAEIAALGFPILHVCGEMDEYVPLEENTIPFEKIIKREGGSIKVICKAGMGHHPHGLEDPAPLIDFILDATYARGD